MASEAGGCLKGVYYTVMCVLQISTKSQQKKWIMLWEAKRLNNLHQRASHTSLNWHLLEYAACNLSLDLLNRICKEGVSGNLHSNILPRWFWCVVGPWTEPQHGSTLAKWAFPALFLSLKVKYRYVPFPSFIQQTFIEVLMRAGLCTRCQEIRAYVRVLAFVGLTVWWAGINILKLEGKRDGRVVGTRGSAFSPLRWHTKPN